MEHKKIKNFKKQLAAYLLVLLLTLSSVLFFGGCAGVRVECICEDDCYGACNFELTVEVESLVLEATHIAWRGGYFFEGYPSIVVTLTNVSGRNITVATANSFRTAVFIRLNSEGAFYNPHISLPPPLFGWRWVSKNLEYGGYISQAPFTFIEGFSRGKHEALISVRFSINHRSRNRQIIHFTYTFMFEVI